MSPESIRSEVEKILASQTFRTAAAQREFLRFAVAEELAGRGHLLKEYSIGIAVFRKRESFDPRLDSIVRSEARKLRVRLRKYFDTEGANDPVRIHLPVGRYAPIFSGQTQGLVQPLAPAVATGRRVFRIAVLPFENRSASKRDEYFSDGLTDELSHAFTRVRGLEVVARTSAFQFKGQPVDVREMGRRLNVHALIEGSVRRSGNRVRILAQLDDAIRGHTIWSANYDRKLTDLFAVQQEIASTITGEIGTHFHAGKALRAPDSGRDAAVPSNPHVYQQYLQGLHLWSRQRLEDFDAAIAFFERVIDKDPTFPRAYTSLAYCYVMLPVIKAVLPSAFVPKIRSAASKALEIDSSLGQAHIALALSLIHKYDWRGAGIEFRKGLELCPSDAVGHAWYGTYLAGVGRGDEALREHARVMELDPASAPAAHCCGQTLYFLRRYDEAAAQFRRALTLDASFPRSHAGLGLACVQQGSYRRGIEELELARELTAGSGRVNANLAYAYARAGNRGKAREILRGFLGRFTPDSFPALMIAEIYIGLGEPDRAFEWLHKAVDQHDLSVFLKCDPLYDPLRADPRFLTLLRRTNLE